MSDTRILPRSGNNQVANPQAGFNILDPRNLIVGANVIGSTYRNVLRPGYEGLRYLGIIGDNQTSQDSAEQDREYIARQWGASANPQKVRKLYDRMKRKATPAQEFTATSHSIPRNVRTGGWPPCPPCKVPEGELKFADWESHMTTYTGDAVAGYDHKLVGTPARLIHGNPSPDTSHISLTSLAEGTGPSQRIGRKVMLVSLDLEAQIWPLNSPALTTPVYPKIYNDILNFCVVLDTQTNGAYPAAIDIFKLAGTSSTMAKPNLYNNTRFKILKWKRKPVNMRLDFITATTHAVITSNPHIKTRVNLNIPATYTDSTSQDIANIKDNSVHIFCWLANQNSVNLQEPVCEINVLSRLRFFDA